MSFIIKGLLLISIILVMSSRKSEAQLFPATSGGGGLLGLGNQQNPILQYFILKLLLDLFKDDGSSKSSWEKVGDCRYKYFTSNKDYEDAEESCEDTDARLASLGIRTESLREEIVDDEFPSSYSSAWVGLKKNAGNMFVWSDGVAYVEGDTPWNTADGQPNDDGGCVRITRSSGDLLSNGDCGGERDYVCEYCS